LQGKHDPLEIDSSAFNFVIALCLLLSELHLLPSY
jgi:hypothetical protein